ncbi:hypothetical protein COOONC_13243 [Cooperia oncophora]
MRDWSSSSYLSRHVQVPKTKQQSRILKQGFADDNNEHLAYFHFRIIWPILAFTVYIYTIFMIGVIGSLITDELPNPLELKKVFRTRYGSLRFRCNVSSP